MESDNDDDAIAAAAAAAAIALFLLCYNFGIERIPLNEFSLVVRIEAFLFLLKYEMRHTQHTHSTHSLFKSPRFLFHLYRLLWDSIDVISCLCAHHHEWLKCVSIEMGIRKIHF